MKKPDPSCVFVLRMSILFFIILVACRNNTTLNQTENLPDSGSPDSTLHDGQAESEISLYAQRVIACHRANPELGEQWKSYLLDKEELFQQGFYRSLAANPLVRVRVECWRGQCVPYAPESECADEATHMALLKALSEKAFPRWGFEFSTQLSAAEADITLHLAFDGFSSTLGNDIYVVYEQIFIHEFLHWVGNFTHHYCGNNVLDTTSCGLVLPEGEGECIMSRNSVVIGTTEACILGITYPDDLQTTKAEINGLIARINNCYPPTW
jgi:hypothetical protein